MADIGPKALELGESIADALFTSSAGEKGDRMVVTTADGRRVAAWSKSKIARFIALIYDRARAR